MNTVNNNELRVGLERDILLPQTERPAAARPEDASFRDLLTGLIDKVNDLQQDADASIKGLVTGETTSIHDVAIKMQEAGVAFDLMMQIRNKLLETYQEISKMQP